MRTWIAYSLVATLGIPLSGVLQGCVTSKTMERDPVLSSATVQVYETSQGLASFYSNRFHGRKTASGERYDRKRLTAAHPKYPFGTWLRVTSDENNKAVVVRVNDRGPRKGSRIVDLSYAAASQLGIVRAGIAGVKVEVIDWPDDPSSRREGDGDAQNGKSVGDGGR
jgi:rare lipoprotein A